jgi:hypothetical protein
VTSKHDDAEAAANALANRIPRDQLSQLLALRATLREGLELADGSGKAFSPELAEAGELAGLIADTELARHSVEGSTGPATA